MGVQGLGFALSVSGVAQLFFYLGILKAKMGEKLGLGHLTVPLLKLVAAAAPAAAGAVAICSLGEWDLGPASLRNWAVLTAAGSIAALLYVILAWILGVAEIRKLTSRIGSGHDRGA
jgi:hypothetical protein